VFKIFFYKKYIFFITKERINIIYNFIYLNSKKLMRIVGKKRFQIGGARRLFANSRRTKNGEPWYVQYYLLNEGMIWGHLSPQSGRDREIQDANNKPAF
jgi:hypothetical protein